MSNPSAGGGRPARRPPLLIQWIGPPPTPERPFGLLRLAQGPEACCYFVEPVPSDLGLADCDQRGGQVHRTAPCCAAGCGGARKRPGGRAELPREPRSGPG